MQLDISGHTTLFYKAEGAGGYGKGAIIHGVVMNDKEKAVALISVRVDEDIAQIVIKDIADGKASPVSGTGTLVSIESLVAKYG